MIQLDKHEARMKLKEMRSTLSSAFVSSRSSLICERCEPLLEAYQCIGIYVGVCNEVATAELIEWCFAHHKKVCCPKVHGKTMDFYEITSFNDLESGVYGLLEPIGKNPIKPEALTCMVMPLVGFNEAGQRIGQGKGYYDKYLKQCECLKIGLAFEWQKIDFEAEAHDIDVDVIITESHVYGLNKGVFYR